MEAPTIVLFPKIQIDTLISYYLLTEFGELKFPGISEGKVEFWNEVPSGKNAFELEDLGYVLIDLGNGRFDHHRLGPDNKTLSAAHLVAQYLGIDEKQELQKLLELARRDDLEGKGIISKDAIDRAFGISGMLMSLMKTYPEKPEYVLECMLPLIDAHYKQEYRRYEELPKEYQLALDEGRAKIFNSVQLGKQLKVVYIETDNPAIPGYLRSKDVGAHLVIQRASTGHVNLISKQAAELELHVLARTIKLLEASKNGLTLEVDDLTELEKPGRTPGLTHWYYDTRANTLQNGGLNVQDIPPTTLTYDELELAVKQGLNISKDQSHKRSDQYNGRAGGQQSLPTRKPFSRQNPRGNYPLQKGERRVRGAIIID